MRIPTNTVTAIPATTRKTANSRVTASSLLSSFCSTAVTELATLASEYSLPPMPLIQSLRMWSGPGGTGFAVITQIRVPDEEYLLALAKVHRHGTGVEYCKGQSALEPRVYMKTGYVYQPTVLGLCPNRDERDLFETDFYNFLGEEEGELAGRNGESFPFLQTHDGLRARIGRIGRGRDVDFVADR